MDVLRISFDGLEKNEKEIFLDIARFFSNEALLKELKKFLSIRGFHGHIGIKILHEKSLISYVDEDFDSIHMHDLLIELGISIVKEKSPKKPWKWTRIWDYKDFHNVMMANKEAKVLEAIVISDNGTTEFLEETVKVDSSSKMNHLNLLILNHVNSFKILNYDYKELRYLSSKGYPYTSLPSTFHPNQLVELILPASNINKLWDGRKCLPNLRAVDLGYSKNLVEIPNLTGAPLLERLDLHGCIKIVKIDPSIGILKELTFLDLTDCHNLRLDLKNFLGLNSLEELYLSGCSKLQNSHLLKKPMETEHLEKVDENRRLIQLSTSSIYQMLMLPFYTFSSRKQEDSLDLLVPYLSHFPCLSVLDLRFCNLLHIPDSIGNLHSLIRLNLGGNKFVTLPNTINQLSKLRHLNLEHCTQLKYLHELPITQEKIVDKYYGVLNIFNCPNLSEIEHFYRVVFSWMIQIFKVYWQSSLSFDWLEIVIPGTEIPRWFSKQNVGDSISIDTSIVVEDPNWIGVACCSLLVAHCDPTNLGHRWHRDGHGSIAYSFQNTKYFRKTYKFVPIDLENDLVTGELHHLFMVFVSREEFLRIPKIDEGETHGLRTRRFTTEIFYHPKGLELKVKSSGYRWVFKEDIQQLNPDMIFRGNSSFRKRKLLSNE